MAICHIWGYRRAHVLRGAALSLQLLDCPWLWQGSNTASAWAVTGTLEMHPKPVSLNTPSNHGWSMTTFLWLIAICSSKQASRCANSGYTKKIVSLMKMEEKVDFKKIFFEIRLSPHFELCLYKFKLQKTQSKRIQL